MDMQLNERRVLVPVRFPVGGIRTYILYNYSTLGRAGYRFTFVGPDDESFRQFQGELDGWTGAEFVPAPVSGGKCHMRNTVRHLLRQSRFCLMHSQGLTAAVDAVLANVGIGLPHIVTSHDTIRPNQFAGRLGASKRWLLGRILRRASVLITVSEDAHENHLRYLPWLERGSCRLVTILHGIDTARFAKPAQNGSLSLRQRLEIGREVFLMGYLGRFMEEKGFLVLVDAIQQVLTECPTESFHLLAVGSADYAREYKAEVHRRPGLADHVTFMEYTPNVADILRELDLVVMPSFREACGLLAMEAMVAGVPVLGSDCLGLREVLHNSPSQMAKTGDSAAWALALRKAIASPWTSEARGYVPTARDRFGIERPARRLGELFDEFARLH